MSFAHPERLFILLAWSALLPFLVLSSRRRTRRWWRLRRAGHPPFASETGWYVAGPLLILALAQPRWGVDPETRLPSGKDVVFVVDVSRSMAARDAVPNRLGVALESATGLLSALADEEGNRAGVVAFAGVPVLRCGLTPNLGAVADALARLRAGEVQPGGTDLAAAVDFAIESFDEYDRSGGRVVVLLTDGEDHPGAWEQSLDRWRNAGVIIHAVAIGDDVQGRPIPAGFGDAPLLHQGSVVESKRVDRPLEALTEATGGVLLKVGLTVADMRNLYRDRIAPREARRRNEIAPESRAERFAPFLLGALGVVLVSRRRPRRRVLPAFMLVPTLLIFFVGAQGPTDLRALVDEGRAAFARGDHEGALVRFEAAARLRPADPLVLYNKGAALFGLGRYAEAAQSYQAAFDQAEGAETPRLKIELCLANCLLMQARPGDAVAGYDRFLREAAGKAGFETLLDDARVNREYALSLLQRKPEAEPEPERPQGSPKHDPNRPSDPPPKSERGENSQAGDSAKSGGGGGQAKSRGAETAEQRLRREAERIREAARSAIPDSPTPASVSGSMKDW